MTYSVVGMGAIGGFYGGRLAHAGRTVRFLLHSDYDFVLQHGLQVDSCDGSFHLDHIDAYAATKDMPLSDVIIVGLKTVKNHDVLPELLRPIVNDDTVVILIQNGIGLEEDLQRLFPKLRIIAGLAFICSAKTSPGHINHQCYGSINLGNYSCPDDLFHTILADLQDAGLQAAEVPYLEARWRKAVWNMPFNGTETWSPGHNGGDARVILKYCYPDWNEGGWPRQESFFNQRYFWVNGEFTPRETMRGKMALLGYLYAIR